MKQMFKPKNIGKKISIHKLQVALFILFFSFSAMAQQNIRGRVSDEKGISVPGATIKIKGSDKGTNTDIDGNFVLSLPSKSSTLIVSMIGYKTKEVMPKEKTDLKIILVEDVFALNDVVVTGVFDKRKRIDASVAISTISAAQIKEQASGSAADLLKNVPGVYVNSSAGEIRNQVVVRGTPISNDISKGYYYVSMQEDGLPVTNLTGTNFGPDYFLRSDINTARVEAVRGGSSSITGSDAPGGLFNYTSKSGGKEFEGEVRLKSGIEGNGNPYYRTDIGLGGALNKSGNLTYYVGGFYRKSDGARNPGYTLNKGGQLKANIKMTTKGGSIKLYAKYLDDKNGTFDFLPYTNFDNPRVAPGFNNTDTFAGGDLNFDYSYSNGGKTRNFNAKNLISNKDKAIGLEINHNFGHGWSIANNFKYSSKSSQFNSQYPLGIFTTNGLTFFAVNNILFDFSTIGGRFNLTNVNTGQNMLTVNRTGFMNFTTVENNLPHNATQTAPAILTLANALDSKVNEIMEQLIINKKIGKTTLTAGSYFGSSKVNVESGYAGQQYVTLENRPQPLGMSFTKANGDVIQFTDSKGMLNNGVGYKKNELVNTRLDLFFAQTSPLTKNLTLDYGIRYNYNQYKGHAEGQIQDMTKINGYDDKPLTIYDNLVYNISNPWSYDQKFNSVSFSGALNYKITEKQAIYGRYSIGSKAPDMSAVVGPETKEAADLLKLEPIHMKQAEIGYKAQMDNFSAYVTPFYSEISNLPQQVYSNDGTGGHYYTPTVYSTQQTIGVEVETNINITSRFKIRAVGTWQDPKSLVSRTWKLNADGISDDEIVEIKNAAIQLTPKVLGSITPSYNTEKFSAFVTWQYTGSAPANASRAFDMAAYDQVSLGLGYNLTKNLDLRFNMNNVFDKLGVTGWYPPGGFPNSLFPDNFTKEQRDANPNAVWGARTTLPRSMFFTLSYKF
jgi:iron complex outermembrane receptor protein